jgi:hypothetical protein
VGKVFRDLAILLVGICVFIGGCVLALRKNPDAPAASAPGVPPIARSASGVSAALQSDIGSPVSATASESDGHLLYACTRGEVVTYSEQPCPPSAKSEMMLVDDPARYTQSATDVPAQQ